MNIPIGLSYDSADCWDLVCLVYRGELGLELGSRWRQLVSRKNGEWEEVAGERETFDLLIFSDGPLKKHVGLVIDPVTGRFAHTIPSIGACIGNYRAVQWRDRLQKTYRHRELESRVV